MHVQDYIPQYEKWRKSYTMKNGENPTLIVWQSMHVQDYIPQYEKWRKSYTMKSGENPTLWKVEKIQHL